MKSVMVIKAFFHAVGDLREECLLEWWYGNNHSCQWRPSSIVAWWSLKMMQQNMKMQAAYHGRRATRSQNSQGQKMRIHGPSRPDRLVLGGLTEARRVAYVGQTYHSVQKIAQKSASQQNMALQVIGSRRSYPARIVSRISARTGTFMQRNYCTFMANRSHRQSLPHALRRKRKCLTTQVSNFN